MNNYTITDIIGEKPGLYGKVRVTFKVEGNDKNISGFFIDAPVVGETISGDIVANGEWLNFKASNATFQKATLGGYQPAPDALRMERKIDALMTEVQMIRTTLSDMKGVLRGVIKDSEQPF